MSKTKHKKMMYLGGLRTEKNAFVLQKRCSKCYAKMERIELGLNLWWRCRYCGSWEIIK